MEEPDRVSRARFLLFSPSLAVRDVAASRAGQHSLREGCVRPSAVMVPGEVTVLAQSRVRSVMTPGGQAPSFAAQGSMQLIGVLHLLGIRQTHANAPALDMLMLLCLLSLWVV